MTRPPPVISVAGQALDPALVALPLTITHGRSGTATQPDAPTCTFQYLSPTVPFINGDAVVVSLQVVAGGGNDATWGDALAMWGDSGVSWDGGKEGAQPRFTGRVVAVTALEADGDITEWQIDCVGVAANLGRVHVTINRPQETDIARVQAICAAANAPVTIVGESTTQLLADSIDTDALNALHQVCSWTAGLIWQGRDGVMYYGTATHRNQEAINVLPDSVIVDGAQWFQNIAEVFNHIVVKWGSPETQNTYRDDDSIAHWGFSHVEVSTKLADQQDVDEFGNTLLVRRASPFWTMPSIVVHSEDCDDAQYYQLNTLMVGGGVLLPVPVEPGPIGTQAQWTVEGWVETWDTPDNQRLQISVSDRQRWGAYALRRWSAMAEQPWSYWVPFTWLEQISAQ